MVDNMTEEIYEDKIKIIWERVTNKGDQNKRVVFDNIDDVIEWLEERRDWFYL